jgi:hypothetical protein
MFAPIANLSPKRRLLCSRDNAHRVASRISCRHLGCVSVIRTCDPLQPFRVTTAPARGDNVELVIVS